MKLQPAVGYVRTFNKDGSPKEIVWQPQTKRTQDTKATILVTLVSFGNVVVVLMNDAPLKKRAKP